MIRVKNVAIPNLKLISDNNNNNNNNDNNNNDNTFMITVTNSNARRFHSVINVFSIVNELIGNPYGARYPWSLRNFSFLNKESKYYEAVTTTARQCILKSICFMAAQRQSSAENRVVSSLIFKSARYFAKSIVTALLHKSYHHFSLFATAELYNQLNLSKGEILKAISSSAQCDQQYPAC